MMPKTTKMTGIQVLAFLSEKERTGQQNSFLRKVAVMEEALQNFHHDIQLKIL